MKNKSTEINQINYQFKKQSLQFRLIYPKHFPLSHWQSLRNRSRNAVHTLAIQRGELQKLRSFAVLNPINHEKFI